MPISPTPSPKSTGLPNDDRKQDDAPLATLIEHLTSLLLVRLLGVAAPPDTFPDYSTTSICRTLLIQPTLWPTQIDLSVLEELRLYVARMLSWYRPYIPYHNAQHAHHVVCSVNKLLDLVVGKSFGQAIVPVTFGLRHDPLRLLSLLWAALVHDVDHHGLPNRQLATEGEMDHVLAIRFNDQSIAENQSLFLAFDELLSTTTTTVASDPETSPSVQPQYANLRHIMCPTKGDYLVFRKHVINLVLNTDIASPEKTQMSRSKFKEANFAGAAAATNTTTPKRESSERRLSASSQVSEMTSTSEMSTIVSGTDDVSSSEDITMRDDDDEDDLGGGGEPEEESTSHDDDDGEEDMDDSGDPNKEGVAQNGEPNSEETANETTNDKDPLPETNLDSPVEAPKFRRRHTTDGTKFQRQDSRRRRPTHHRSRSAIQLSMFRPKRLGLRRSMDLSGEMLEQYDNAGRHKNNNNSKAQITALAQDQPDELKASVVMEIIMTAADIAPNLQSWDHMVKWSNRLYLELRRAHAAGRGPDASPDWYRNQIGFLEYYVLPLARKMDETGVFGEMVGPSFARLVEANRDRWLLDGEKVTKDITEKGKNDFPDETSIPLEECLEIDLSTERSLWKNVAVAAAQSPSKSEHSAAPSPSHGSTDEVSTPTNTGEDSSRARLREQELHNARESLKEMAKKHQSDIVRMTSNHHGQVDGISSEMKELAQELDQAKSTIETLESERDALVQQQKEKDEELSELRKKLEALQSSAGRSELSNGAATAAPPQQEQKREASSSSASSWECVIPSRFRPRRSFIKKSKSDGAK